LDVSYKLFSNPIISHGDKTEATTVACVGIPDNLYVSNLAKSLKMVSKISLSQCVIKSPNENTISEDSLGFQTLSFSPLTTLISLENL
jgi:hypothetical protein